MCMRAVVRVCCCACTCARMCALVLWKRGIERAVRAFTRSCVCVHVHACVRACVRACARACVWVCVHLRGSEGARERGSEGASKGACVHALWISHKSRLHALAPGTCYLWSASSEATRGPHGKPWRSTNCRVHIGQDLFTFAAAPRLACRSQKKANLWEGGCCPVRLRMCAALS